MDVYATKKKYTEYAELTRVVTDSHNKTISVMTMTMMIVIGL